MIKAFLHTPENEVVPVFAKYKVQADRFLDVDPVETGLWQDESGMWLAEDDKELEAIKGILDKEKIRYTVESAEYDEDTKRVVEANASSIRTRDRVDAFLVGRGARIQALEADLTTAKFTEEQKVLFRKWLPTERSTNIG